MNYRAPPTRERSSNNRDEGLAAPAGLHREALAVEPKVFGRFEADAPNDRWITDVLASPWVPLPRTDRSVRALIISALGPVESSTGSDL